ncbi:hypothetical protein ABMA28_006146 [Loxostege sticticalis]|uniref:Transposable element P transposase n=1 Tax=Loxostege sticticalis TaxID=481309 RepID=A0ABD0SK61_LOXSC
MATSVCGNSYSYSLIAFMSIIQVTNTFLNSLFIIIIRYKEIIHVRLCDPHYSIKAIKGKKLFRVYMTKTEKELYDKIVAARIKICKMKNKLKIQAAHIKAAKTLVKNSAFLETLENCSSMAKLLMQIQWREDKKKEKGRRFTLDEKIAALSVYKQSPKAYRYLRKIFILPSEQTLCKVIQRSNLKPGINKNIFEQLKKKAETMKTEEKLCILLFDEVSLKPFITYQERKDHITGLVDNGAKREKEFADHAQVFMIRGLIKNYKQPVSYSFSSSATKGPELARQVKEVVTEIQRAGLIVVASVCDQGTNNRQALKILINESRGIFLRRGEEYKENIILINDQEIVPLYDPPHLLKGMRNNLINKNLIYVKEGVAQTAKWTHLDLLHKENPGYKGIRLIPKLSENHINPIKMNKMKVKFASQLFSRTVASNMGYLADKKILPIECKETADFLLFMDEIFDSVNGSFGKNKNAKPLLGPVTPNSAHHQTWAEGIAIFKSMKFVTSSGKKETVPTIDNWVWTLEGIKVLLQKVMSKYGVTSVWLRHLNQDPLENFFGAVRSHGCRNTNPTCDQFESAYATLLINNLSSVHAQGKNCEMDFCNSLHNFIIDDAAKAPATCTFDAEIFEFQHTPIEDKEQDPRIIAPIMYMSGYFVKKSKTKIYKKCSLCASNLSSQNEIEYIKYREYAGRRWLCTPSKPLIELVSKFQDIINYMIRKYIAEINLKEMIKTAIMILVDFDFIKCMTHKDKLIDYLINIVIRCFLFNYCKMINSISSGKRQVDDEDDEIQMKAKKINRCLKRHK